MGTDSTTTKKLDPSRGRDNTCSPSLREPSTGTRPNRLTKREANSGEAEESEFKPAH